MDLSTDKAGESNETFVRINEDFTEMYIYTTNKDIQELMDALRRKTKNVVFPGKIGKKEMQGYIVKDYETKRDRTQPKRIDGFTAVWLTLEKKILGLGKKER